MGVVISRLRRRKLQEEDPKEKKKVVLQDKLVLKTLQMNRRVDQMLRLKDLKSPLLQAAFQKNSLGVLEILEKLRIEKNMKQYEHDITLVFWFAIHLENLDLASLLLEKEFLLKQLVACALMNRKDDDDSEDAGSEEEGEEWNINSNRQSDESFKSENLSEEDKNQEQHEGGEDELLDMDDDDDVFSDDQGEQNNGQQQQQQQQQKQEEKKEEVKQENSSSKGTDESPQKKNLGQMLAELKKKKQEEEEQMRREAEQKASQQALEAIGLTSEMILNTKIESIQKLIEVKNSFRAKFQNLMTNVLKIALQKEEEKLACIITAYYEITLEEEMIIRALSSNTYKWLFFVWAFDKNYIGSRHRNGLFISYEQLFDLILKQNGGMARLAEPKIKQVVEWKIISADNILKALVNHNLDQLAINYMGYYNHFLDKDLFIFCMTHGNSIFLQQALKLAAFDKMIFRDEQIINQILTILKEGYRTNFLMNILSLIDISVWKNKHLKDLVEIINDYVEENYDKNRLLLSPNPIMSIALAAELLNTIARSRRKFENECKKIEKELLELGKMYSRKIEDEKFYETQIMGQDFKGRTVLKIITQNGFESLMDQDDPKAENLMLMIWHGKEATKCDGNIYGYSNLAHLIMTRAKKISGKKTSLMQMVTNYFEPNFKVDYSFQYRYRSRAVSFFFYKEFLCALAMLVIFQYINYKYLILFSDNYLNTPETTTTSEDGTTTDGNGRINKIIKSIREYIDWNFFALFFSAALLLQLLLKILFNICSKKKKISMDKWTIMDSISAILNIMAVQLIKNIVPSDFEKPDVKDIVDYFMILVLCICWLRFFTYFLVVRSISKLILTLMAMIGDTVSFMFILICYIAIMASVFTTLYQDTNPDKYGGLAISVRYLFDAAIGQYDYEGMGDRNISHSVLLMCHVFFSNILLLNYLIAILSTTYENMKETGIFKYKSNLYQYCERFMTAFDERSYGEIILHPPPLSYLSTMMMPFLVSSFLMRYVAAAFSYFMYWLENIFFIWTFLGIEMMIAPVAYIKIWINIIRNSMGVFKTILNCIVIGLIGFVMILFLMFRDVAYLIKILCYHQGCRYGKIDELAEEVLDSDVKVKVYNETRSTVISLYKRLQKHMKQEGEQQEESDEEDELEDPDFFHIEDDENMNEDFLYVVKKSLIIDEWKKRRIQIERMRIFQEMKMQGVEMKNKLAESFKKRLGKQASSINLKGDSSSWSINKSVNNLPKHGDNSGAKKGKDLANHLKVVFLETLKKGRQGKQQDEELEQIDMSDYVIPEREIVLVDEFLTKFTIVSESSMNEHLDIMLMLKALPNKIMLHNIEATEMFNFRIFQESLIAYQNIDLVNAFEYIDDKNRERIQNVKEKLVNQKTNLNDVKDILELVKIKIERNEEYFSKQKGINANGGSSSNNNNNNDNLGFGGQVKQSKVVDNIHKREINV